MALIEAARYSDAAELSRLLAAGADLNVVDAQGGAAIHAAARRRDGIELLRLLLATGASPRLADRNGHLPLHIAAERADGRERVLLLLEADPSAAAVSVDGETALSGVCRSSDDAQLAQAVLDVAPGVLDSVETESNDVFDMELSPLEVALYYGHPQVARTLLAATRVDPALAMLRRFAGLQGAALTLLYVELLRRGPLTRAQWGRVPVCYRLPLLPTLLWERSVDEAAELVRGHLNGTQVNHLRAAVLALGRRRACGCLPLEVMCHILSSAFEGYGDEELNPWWPREAPLEAYYE